MTDILQPSSAPGAAIQTESEPTTRHGTVTTHPNGVPTHMTWEEYLAWDFEDGQAEWVDGEVVLMPPVRADHQFIAGFLYRLIFDFVERHGLGVVFQTPMLMKLSVRPSGREPDVMFIASVHEDRIKQALVDGPADLAIEVVSPDSDRRDRAEKFREYEEGGVTEYWLIDGLRKQAYFYVLGEDGRYHLAPIADDGSYFSHVLEGFRLRVDWLWRMPLPTLSAALAELGD
jgi:Uma2 family endonuclease